MTKQAGTLYTDERGNEYKKVAENKDYFFLAPFSVEEDGGKRVDMENIKAFSKAEPDYPLQEVIDYTS